MWIWATIGEKFPHERANEAGVREVTVLISTLVPDVFPKGLSFI